MKTFTIPGGLAGPPSACSSALDHIDVFAVKPGGQVWRVSGDGVDWHPAVELPRISGVIPAEGVCAISSGPGRVEVFAVERGSRTPIWWRGNGTMWTQGAPLLAGI